MKGDDDFILYARIVTAGLSGVLISLLVLAAIFALFDDNTDAGELVGMAAIVVPALVGLAGYALGIGRILK